MLESVVANWPVQFERLFAAFMPGPLTLVLVKRPSVPDVVTAGRPTVAVRFPAHPIAQQLIAACGLPIAAPSANRFQRVSATSSEHALADLDGRIEAILDDGPSQIGVESTVLDLTEDVPRILRQGAVTLEHLLRVTGNNITLATSASHRDRPRGMPSPGMMSLHYAPSTKLMLSDDDEKALKKVVQGISGLKTGALLPSGWDISATTTFDWGRWGDWKVLASRLYAGLRWLDAQKLDVIVAPLPPDEELGGAIRERLLKASGGDLDPKEHH
jgi:L-threonylcarbamoyladenylate synthase